MSAAKHTPGPWMVDDEQEAKYHLYVRHVDSGRICQCFANCLVATDAAVLANARLIAAAPELLEALQRYVALDVKADGYDGKTMRQDSGLHRSAVAAIAKAGGAS